MLKIIKCIKRISSLMIHSWLSIKRHLGCVLGVVHARVCHIVSVRSILMFIFFVFVAAALLFTTSMMVWGILRLLLILRLRLVCRRPMHWLNHMLHVWVSGINMFRFFAATAAANNNSNYYQHNDNNRNNDDDNK